MVKRQKPIQEEMLELRMKDEKHQYYVNRLKLLWTLLKRVTLVVSLGYGVLWASKSENQPTIKSFLKSHSAPIEKKVNNFKEGLGIIKDTLNEKPDENYHKEREKHIKEYKKVGVDPTFKYAEHGTKEYRETLEYYRKEGVFSGRD